MKKFLCLVLVMFLGVGVFAFTACKKDKGYDIAKFKDDYLNLTTDLNSFSYNVKEDKIEIDYSSFVDSKGNNYLQTAMATSPYTCLANYNTLFENSINFANSYYAACSNAKKVKKSLRNNLQTNLKDLLTAMQKVDLLTQNFANQVHFSVSGNITDRIYLSTFSYLTNSYGELFSAAYDLTTTMSRIYYNYLFTNSNPNVYEIPTKSFDVFDILKNLESRSKFEIAALSFGFYRTNLADGEIEDAIIDGTFEEIAGYAGYETKVKTLSVPVSTEEYKNKLEADANLKTSFRNYSIELYNVQTCLDNDFEKFYKAKSSVDFKAEIEEDYYYLLEKNYEALARILSLF